MASSSVTFEWRTNAQRFRSGISLHGHTYHSKERLGFIPRYSRMVPGLKEAVDRQCLRYREIHDRDINFNNGWWTPPLSPASAYAVESKHITDSQLYPIVSLSDHDDICAPLELLGQQVHVPISVEWTVPIGERSPRFHPRRANCLQPSALG